MKLPKMNTIRNWWLTQSSIRRGAAFGVIFAGVGTAALLGVSAASVFVASEPETGSLSGTSAAVDDANTSGGKYIRFNAAAAPTPPPPSTPPPSPPPPTSGVTFPNCAGLGPTTALATSNGSFWSDQGSASGKAIVGDMILDSSAPNYTTSNFSVTGKINSALNGGSMTVSDFLVKAPSYDGDWGIGYHNITARRFRIENHADGIRVAGTGNSLYEDFCITAVSRPADHSDGVQFYGATNPASNTTFRRGIITMPSSDVTAGIFSADGAKGSITIDTVLFIGGPYGIRINSDGNSPIAVRNVRFRRGSFGAAPFSIASNIRITEWTNVAYEDGQAIPPPHAVQP